MPLAPSAMYPYPVSDPAPYRKHARLGMLGSAPAASIALQIQFAMPPFPRALCKQNKEECDALRGLNCLPELAAPPKSARQDLETMVVALVALFRGRREITGCCYAGGDCCNPGNICKLPLAAECDAAINMQSRSDECDPSVVADSVALMCRRGLLPRRQPLRATASCRM